MIDTKKEEMVGALNIIESGAFGITQPGPRGGSSTSRPKSFRVKVCFRRLVQSVEHGSPSQPCQRHLERLLWKRHACSSKNGVVMNVRVIHEIWTHTS